MCTTCGCGGGGVNIEKYGFEPHSPHENDVNHGHGHAHHHSHGYSHSHYHEHEHHHTLPDPVGQDVNAAANTGPIGGVHAPGLSRGRIVQIEQDILSVNQRFADANRRRLGDAGIFAVNLVSSPGSGKTTLLVRTLETLQSTLPIAVVEGDQQTNHDAERIRQAGAPAIQINTGKGCHLDAHMVGHALDRLAPAPESLLLIENVGNLVCPAAFDLGESHKVVILSVTEGEDKPLKYPDMFYAASLMLLNKVDLLPYLCFDVELAIDYARRINPTIDVILASAVDGTGMDRWHAWLRNGLSHAIAERGKARREPEQSSSAVGLAKPS